MKNHPFGWLKSNHLKSTCPLSLLDLLRLFLCFHLLKGKDNRYTFIGTQNKLTEHAICFFHVQTFLCKMLDYATQKALDTKYNVTTILEVGHFLLSTHDIQWQHKILNDLNLSFEAPIFPRVHFDSTETEAGNKSCQLKPLKNKPLSRQRLFPEAPHYRYSGVVWECSAWRGPPSSSHFSPSFRLQWWAPKHHLTVWLRKRGALLSQRHWCSALRWRTTARARMGVRWKQRLGNEQASKLRLLRHY